MSNSLYKIADEPSPGALSSLAVRPLWPFIAIMFGGVWLSWSWFAVNGIAVGSPTKRLEWSLIAGGLAGCVVLILGISAVIGNEWIADAYNKYLVLVIVVWKLGITYALYVLQDHTIELYEYYGGSVKNGVYVILAAFFVSPPLLENLPGFAKILLS
jgi:hypothetical protein